jgi:hypothetical protein
MLNARWFIVQGGDGAPQAAYNPDANGAAWLARDIRLVGSPDEEIAALGEADLKRTAIVDRSFMQAAITTPMDTTATIELVDYRINRLTYKYSSLTQQLAVFSEIYYPEGWTATMDGQPLDYFRADYLLRAALLPAGEHEIVFSFRIPHFETISAITLACNILIFLLLAAALSVTGFKCKKRDDKERE